MRRLLPLLLLPALGCPTWNRMEPEAICDETALVVGLLGRDCFGLTPRETAEFRDAFAAEVTCMPPAESLDPDQFECIDALANMTCDQVERKGDDWAEWLEISFVCHEYLTLE